MTEDIPFSSISPRRPVSLLDLVQTESAEESHSFLARVKRSAEGQGGRVWIANKTVHPMILPDEQDPAHEQAIRLLVVTRYPRREAGERALADRAAWESDFSADAVQTFAVRPVDPVESFVGRTLPHTLGRLKRETVPVIQGPAERDAMIEKALVLGEQPDAARWRVLIDRAGHRPIWMLNCLQFAKEASYTDAQPDSAPISGAEAYRRYGRGMIRSLAAVGGRVGWSGYPLSQVAGRADGRWHQIAIAVYPSPAAMLTMLALSKYRAAHVHRAAGLARTRLLATQPMDETS